MTLSNNQLGDIMSDEGLDEASAAYYFLKMMELIQESRRQLKRDYDNEALSYQTFFERAGHLEKLEQITEGLIEETGFPYSRLGD